MILLWVGLGGAVGSIARYLVGEAIRGWVGGGFPVWTLAINVIGCLAIGVLSRLAETQGWFTADVRAFALVGVLGGFTTFSTFGNETVTLVREGRFGAALVYVGASVLLGLGAVAVGRGVVG